MAKTQEMEIKETLVELKKTLSKCKNLKEEKRVRMLIGIQENGEETRQALANKLGVHKRTMERWITKYKKGGLMYLMKDLPQNKVSKIFTKSIHEGLYKRVNNPNTPFSSYVEAQDWIFEEYGKSIKYNSLRSYLIEKFGTKVKSPRKSHIKKDPEAEKAFLKTNKEVQTHRKNIYK